MSVGTPADGMSFWWNKWIEDEQPAPVNQLPQPQAMTTVRNAHDFAEWFAKQCAEVRSPGMAKRFEIGRFIFELDEKYGAAYLYTDGQIPDAGVAFTREADDEGRVNLDYNSDGKLIGVEILPEAK